MGRAEVNIIADEVIRDRMAETLREEKENKDNDFRRETAGCPVSLSKD